METRTAYEILKLSRETAIACLLKLRGPRYALNFDAIEFGRYEAQQTGSGFEFWEKGKKGEKTTRVTESGNLVISKPSGKLVLATVSSPSIDEYVCDPSGFPIFRFVWEDVEGDNLTMLRIDLNSDEYVNYIKDRSRFIPDNGSKHPLEYYKLPQVLEGNGEVLGTPIKWKINFDEKASEILKESELREFFIEMEKLAEA